MTALVAVVAALAVYRLTLLAVADEITKPLRQRFVDAHSTVTPNHVVTYDDHPPDEPPTAAECACGDRWVIQVVDPYDDVPSLAPVVAEHLAVNADDETVKLDRWATLITCPWCVSWWLALPVVWSAWAFGDRAWWFVPAAALAASGTTGALSQHAAP